MKTTHLVVETDPNIIDTLIILYQLIVDTSLFELEFAVYNDEYMPPYIQDLDEIARSIRFN